MCIPAVAAGLLGGFGETGWPFNVTVLYLGL